MIVHETRALDSRDAQHSRCSSPRLATCTLPHVQSNPNRSSSIVLFDEFDESGYVYPQLRDTTYAAFAPSSPAESGVTVRLRYCVLQLRLAQGGVDRRLVAPGATRI